MTDNLTLRLKNDLEKKHNRVVSVEEINTFLQSQGLGENPTGQKSFQAPQQYEPPDWLKAEEQEEVRESKGGALNALGVGLWTALDTAAFGIPGAFVEEEKVLDFQDPIAKYTGAVGGLLGFIGGAPMKIGAKILQVPFKAVAKRAGYETVETVTKKMLKKGVDKGAPITETKTLVSSYKKLAHQAQTNPDIRENFADKSIKLLTKFTDDAVAANRISPNEAVVLKELFTDNVLKRPLQDFIGLMGTRGLAATNPRLAKVLGHAINDSIMFGAIDTIFETVSMIEDGNFDWTAPAWGVATGAAFSQISWLKPVGKQAKWFQDVKQGIRASFAKPPNYIKYSNKKLAQTGRFFGESLERIGQQGGAVVTLEYNGIKASGIDLTSDNLLKIAGDRFGSKKLGKEALAKFFNNSRISMGKGLINEANKQGAKNLALNWKRMMLGGVLFNTHTIADMAISGDSDVDINDVLPHFLIGAFLQIGKNPASFDLNSSKINQFRYNLALLGIETKQLTQIPSLENTSSRFNSAYKDGDAFINELKKRSIGSEISEDLNIKLLDGEVSSLVETNTKWDDYIRPSLKQHFSFLRTPDQTSSKEIKELVKIFEESKGVKTIEQYKEFFRKASVENTKNFESIFPTIIEQISQIDRGQELSIDTEDGTGKYRINKRISTTEEIYERARKGEFKDWLGNLEGEAAVRELAMRLDGFAVISESARVMESAVLKPGVNNNIEIKTLDTVKDIYKIIKEKETSIENQFPSKMSYSDRFSFINNHSDTLQIITRNLFLKNNLP